MASEINKEIAAIMQLFPFKYSEQVYNTPVKKFKIILNEIHALGVHAGIVSVRQPLKFLHDNPTYKYQVQINFEVVKNYASSNSAKKYLLRYYLRLKKEQDGKKE